MKNIVSFFGIAALFLLLGFVACRDSEYTLPDQYTRISDNGNGVGTTTWKADTKYLIDINHRTRHGY
jgi:hypothetical protein